MDDLVSIQNEVVFLRVISGKEQKIKKIFFGELEDSGISIW